MTATTQRTGRQVLKELATVSAKLAKKDAEAHAVREQRNKLVAEARKLKPPVKLKDLAQITGLGTTFIGRIEHGKGKPDSGIGGRNGKVKGKAPVTAAAAKAAKRRLTAVK
jgi:ribosome-binding protein aMBF1 (putative translation factor)